MLQGLLWRQPQQQLLVWEDFDKKIVLRNFIYLTLMNLILGCLCDFITPTLLFVHFIHYSILRVLLVYEMTWDWTATFSNQSSFYGLEGKIVTLSKNWFSSAL